MSETRQKIFESLAFANGITLRNRIVMAPMTTWSANADGTVSDDEIEYYRRRINGVGLVITGCTHVLQNGVGFTGEFAAYDDAFIPSLRRLAEAAKSGGAPAILQIFHAGNKALPNLIPGGDVVSASAAPTEASPFCPAVSPRELDHEAILSVIQAFGDATRRAIEAGFDGVELHGAHGFLIQNFLSPKFNRRADGWGGTFENRMRFPLAVVTEVKRVIDFSAKRPFLLGYRISPEEPDEGGLRISETLHLAQRLADSGIDYLHLSLTNLLDAKPMGTSHGRTIAELMVERVCGRIPIIAAGRIRKPEQAAKAIDLGLSLVAIGQGLVVNPDWVELAEGGFDAQILTTLNPKSISKIGIPEKLWAVIESAKGWFEVEADSIDVPDPGTSRIATA